MTSAAKSQVSTWVAVCGWGVSWETWHIPHLASVWGLPCQAPSFCLWWLLVSKGLGTSWEAVLPAPYWSVQGMCREGHQLLALGRGSGRLQAGCTLAPSLGHGCSPRGAPAVLSLSVPRGGTTVALGVGIVASVGAESWPLASQRQWAGRCVQAPVRPPFCGRGPHAEALWVPQQGLFLGSAAGVGSGPPPPPAALLSLCLEKRNRICSPGIGSQMWEVPPCDPTGIGTCDHPVVGASIQRVPLS